MDFYKEDGEKVTLLDIVEWWNEKYPKSVFKGKTREGELVASIREDMNELIKNEKERD